MTFDEWLSSEETPGRPAVMTHEQINSLLRQCWIVAQYAERERCAQIAHDYGARLAKMAFHDRPYSYDACEDIAEEIREITI